MKTAIALLVAFSAIAAEEPKDKPAENKTPPAVNKTAEFPEKTRSDLFILMNRVNAAKERLAQIDDALSIAEPQLWQAKQKAEAERNAYYQIYLKREKQVLAEGFHMDRVLMVLVPDKDPEPAPAPPAEAK